MMFRRVTGSESSSESEREKRCESQQVEVVVCVNLSLSLRVSVTSSLVLEYPLHLLHVLGLRELSGRGRREARYLLVRHKSREIDLWKALHQESLHLLEGVHLPYLVLGDAYDVSCSRSIPFDRQETKIDACLGGCPDAPTVGANRDREDKEEEGVRDKEGEEGEGELQGGKGWDR
jgi:hypothetical protein